MRIVINDHLGHAAPVQLSRALAARGHDVLHIYSSHVQSPKADLRRQPDDPAGLAIEGLTLGSRKARSFFGERLQESKFGSIVVRRAMAFHPDVVMACNNPLDVQRKVQSACLRAHIPFVYWLQDFQAPKIDEMIKGRGTFLNVAIGSHYHSLEQKLLQRSDVIIGIDHDQVGILAQSWDVYERQCMVVHNWSPLDRLSPGGNDKSWARGLGIIDKKIALYTGSLNAMESPMLLVRLAERLRERPDIQILVVSEGAGAERVAHEVKSLALSNLRVLPFQPYEIYGDVLANADVLLATVDAEAGVLFVPSKVNSYLCAGRPIVLSAPWHNLAAATLRNSGGGCVVPPDDAAAMAEAILAFLDDNHRREETSARARDYAERMFEISAITDRFERLFVRLTSGPRRRPRTHS